LRCWRAQPTDDQTKRKLAKAKDPRRTRLVTHKHTHTLIVYLQSHPQCNRANNSAQACAPRRPVQQQRLPCPSPLPSAAAEAVPCRGEHHRQRQLRLLPPPPPPRQQRQQQPRRSPLLEEQRRGRTQRPTRRDRACSGPAAASLARVSPSAPHTSTSTSSGQASSGNAGQ
jgi:hypothetical protein